MTLPITSWHADEGLPNARPLARCAAMPLSFDRDQLPIWRDERNRNSLLLAGGVQLALVIALSLSISTPDRKSVGEGKGVSVRDCTGGRRRNRKKKNNNHTKK